jgi:hypothetical protein
MEHMKSNVVVERVIFLVRIEEVAGSHFIPY